MYALSLEKIQSRLGLHRSGKPEGVGVRAETGIMVGIGEAFGFAADANVVITAGNELVEITEVIRAKGAGNRPPGRIPWPESCC